MEGGREDSIESPSSRTIGGCGDRPFLYSFRVDIEEGEREGGKDEKDGCLCSAGAAGPLPFILWLVTSFIGAPFSADQVGAYRRCGAGVCRGRSGSRELKRSAVERPTQGVRVCQV
jgi:hypothetical protein